VFCENSNGGKAKLYKFLLIYDNCCSIFWNNHFRP